MTNLYLYIFILICIVISYKILREHYQSIHPPTITINIENIIPADIRGTNINTFNDFRDTIIKFQKYIITNKHDINQWNKWKQFKQDNQIKFKKNSKICVRPRSKRKYNFFRFCRK